MTDNNNNNEDDDDDNDNDDDDDGAAADVSDTEKVYECDLVLLAMGFVGPETAILDDLSLAQDARGNIDASDVKYVTSVPRVYAAGGTSHISMLLCFVLCQHVI